MAAKEDEDFRRGLPTDYKLFMGLQNSDREDVAPQREEFMNTVGHLMNRLVDYCELDKDVDEFARLDMHRSFPPKLTKEEIQRTVKGKNLSKLCQIVYGP